MDFNYSEEQLALQDTLQALHRDATTTSNAAARSRARPGLFRRCVAQYAALGLLALPFPGEFGGLGGNGVDIMVVMELIRARPVARALLEHRRDLRRIDSRCCIRCRQETVLPRSRRGNCRSRSPPTRPRGAMNSRTSPAAPIASGDGWRLTGGKSVVLDAPSADYFLVSARSSGKLTDADGISLFLVKRDAPGTRTATPIRRSRAAAPPT
jgi:alkylation response protein AidB-like acyl-CoA dehydrogenase